MDFQNMEMNHCQKEVQDTTALEEQLLSAAILHQKKVKDKEKEETEEWKKKRTTFWVRE